MTVRLGAECPKRLDILPSSGGLIKEPWRTIERERETANIYLYIIKVTSQIDKLTMNGATNRLAHGKSMAYITTGR